MPWDGGTDHAWRGEDTAAVTTLARHPEVMPGRDATPRRCGSHRAARRARRGLAVAGIAVTVVGTVAAATTVLGGGFGQLLGEPGPSAVRVSPMQSDPALAASSLAGPVTTTPSPAPVTGGPSTTPSLTPTATPSASVGATGTVSAARRAPSASTRPSSASPTRTTSSATTAPVAAGDALAQQVLDQINQARADAGLSALTMSAGLVRSASKHTQLMAGGCGLAHQCSGEAALGSRISAEGVSWTAVGENIGYGGPVAASDSAIVGMAKQLTASMLAEKPPNDGHRKNILSTAFHHIGISLYRDSKGTVWMTQDFSS